MNDYQQYIALSRYARFLPNEKRRETWEETVDRYVDYFANRIEQLVPKGFTELQDEVVQSVRDSILNLEVMPSMRALMTAGPALDRDNVAGFNCAYMPIEDQRCFDELMYILMCGTGVGFSVERQYIQRLPPVAEEFHETETVISVRDSKIGWSSSFRQLISLLYSGQIPKWDLSKVREAGKPLKTFGGRASGPEPLDRLFKFVVNLFKGASGRRLTSLECHDICCKVAEIVVVGGVRRSALISLSNLTDDRMRRAKLGNWHDPDQNPQRMLANNSVAYTEIPEMESFLREGLSLYESKAGERGIFSRPASKAKAGENGRRDADQDFGTNPCSEIILRPYQFCNLSEVVVREDDTLSSLKRKVRLAAIVGTLQSTLSDFRYLRKIWKDNTEEERLLGVSLTGIMDNAAMSGGMDNDAGIAGRFCGDEDMMLSDVLAELKQVVIDTNKEWSKKLGIQQSTATTCVKPSGTVSQLVNSSSGIHARYSPYYIRRAALDIKDPLGQLMVDQGIPYEKDATKYYFMFPTKAPESCVTGDEVGAIDMLELVDIYNKHWCEHKVSCTIQYAPEEFLAIWNWVYEHFDEVSGISMFPRSGHIFDHPPYEPISEEQYNKMVSNSPPEIDWSQLGKYEFEDNTEGSQELACVGNMCEV